MVNLTSVGSSFQLPPSDLPDSRNPQRKRLRPFEQMNNTEREEANSSPFIAKKPLKGRIHKKRKLSPDQPSNKFSFQGTNPWEDEDPQLLDFFQLNLSSFPQDFNLSVWKSIKNSALNDPFLSCLVAEAEAEASSESAQMELVFKQLTRLIYHCNSNPAVIQKMHSYPAGSFDKLSWMRKWLKDRSFLKFFDYIAESLPQAKDYTCSLAAETEEGQKVVSLRKWMAENRGALESLTSLNLRDLIEVPDEIGFCPNLQILDLEYNLLKILPKSLFQLVHLQTLNLSSNNLKVIPESLFQLVNLQTLNLSFNKLKVISDAIGQLKNLKSLDLSNNYLTSLPKSLGCLELLEKINLYDNRLQTLPESFGKLIHLTTLNLAANKIENIPNSFANLSNLKKLRLDDNKLEDIPKNFSQLVQLKTLRLSGNNLQIIPDDICNLIKLEVLDLTDNELQIVPVSISNLTSLKKLILQGNPLEELPNSIGDMANLEELDLYDSDLKAIPESFAKLINLKKLYLTGTPIHIDDVLRIMQQQIFSGKLDLSILDPWPESEPESPAQMPIGWPNPLPPFQQSSMPFYPPLGWPFQASIPSVHFQAPQNEISPSEPALAGGADFIAQIAQRTLVNSYQPVSPTPFMPTQTSHYWAPTHSSSSNT